MICPYCDSRVKDLPDNHVCPHCGGPLGKYCDTEQRKPAKKLQFPEPPTGIYTNSHISMEIGETSVKFCKWSPNGSDMIRIIAFEEIAEVSFKPSGIISPGFIYIRGCHEGPEKMPKTWLEASAKTYGFLFSEDEKFLPVGQFFKWCAEINKDA